MKLTKRDKQLIISALHEAIETLVSLIDAHRVAWDQRRKGNPERCIPKEYRREVQKWNTRIKRYRKMILRLQ